MLIKMGKSRFLPVTLAPLVFLSSVTFTAGLTKIFSSDPALGFLAGARAFGDKIAAGGSPTEMATWHKIMHMNQIDAAVTGFFLLCVAVILTGCAIEWARLLSGRKCAVLHESPYVPYARFAEGMGGNGGVPHQGQGHRSK